MEKAKQFRAIKELDRYVRKKMRETPAAVINGNVDVAGDMYYDTLDHIATTLEQCLEE